MCKVVLIACGKRKLDRTSRAEDLYIGSLFKKSLEYAKLLNPNKIFILSAKHKLLHLDDIVDPYNLSLNTMRVNARREWANEVFESLSREVDINNTEFIVLAGVKYRQFLLNQVSIQIPMEHMGIGNQLSWLQNQINSINNN